MKKFVLVLFFLPIYTVIFCQKNAPKKVANDSISLKQLVIKMLEWHQKDTLEDFAMKSDNDTFYSKIDWSKHRIKCEQLRKTNMFTESFVTNYTTIATTIEVALTTNPEKYFIGELPPYSDDYDPWCKCQDYPYNFKQKIKISNLKINGNEASFNWTWIKSHPYIITAIKEKNIWKIESMESLKPSHFKW